MKKPVGRFIHHFVVILIIIPLALAALGAIIEVSIYEKELVPNFHVKWLPISGLIAGPFILLRTLWKWPKWLTKLEIFIYIMQTVGFFLTITQIIIVGHQHYVANAGIRQLLTTSKGSDIFSNILTEDDVWTWLNHVVDTAYADETQRDILGHKLPGRLVWLTSLRVKQYRVRPVCCSEFYRTLFRVGGEQCYPMFSEEHESRGAYGTNLTFSYADLPYISATGQKVSMHGFEVHGNFGSYPLAGFWTYFPPSILRETAKKQLAAMRESNWIDHQTRAITIDMALMTPDELHNPVWPAALFIIERNHIGQFSSVQPNVYFNSFDYVSLKFNLNGGAPLSECNASLPNFVSYLHSLPADQAQGFLGSALPQGEVCSRSEPAGGFALWYTALMPSMVYTIYVIIAGLIENWKIYLTGPFNWILAMWVMLLLLVYGLRVNVFRYLECSFTFFPQPTFSRLDPNSTEAILTRSPPRLEYLPLALNFTDARRFLAISVFLHLFSILRFVVNLKSLGVMVRTIGYAAMGLTSFSLSFFVIFLGFATMFYYIFSVDVLGFSTVPRTIATLWLGMLGEVDLTPELWRSRDWTIALFIIFTFLSAFVLLTLIISIISSGHNKATMYLATAKAESGENVSETASTATEHFQELLSEEEMLLAVIEKWKAVTMQRKRARIAPSHQEHDTVVLTGTMEMAESQSAGENSLSARTLLQSKYKKGDESVPDQEAVQV